MVERNWKERTLEPVILLKLHILESGTIRPEGFSNILHLQIENLSKKPVSHISFRNVEMHTSVAQRGFQNFSEG